MAQMATSFGTEEFRIDTSQVEVVRKRTKKVERLFGVKVTFDLMSVVGDHSNQWLVVSGNKENRQKATRYIQSMCNPEQTTSLKVSGRPSLDDAVLEDVERTSNAFIHRTGSLTLQVMGSELECTLAISQLEQVYRVAVTGITVGDEETLSAASKSQTPSGVPPISPTEVVNSLKDMMVNGSGAINPPSLEDSQLFGSGGEAQSLTDRPSHLHTSPTLPQASQSAVSPQTVARSTGTTLPESLRVALNLPAERVSSSGVMKTGKGNAGESSRKGQTQTEKTMTSPQRSEVKDTSELGQKAVSESCVGEPAAEELKQKSELQSLGLGMGYTQKEIEDTLLFFDFSHYRVQPHEFLTALDDVRANRVKEDRKTDSALHAAQSDQKHFPRPPVAHKGSTPNKQKPGKGKQAKTKSVTPPRVTKPSMGKSTHYSPSAIEISPEKSPSPADVSVYVLEEEGNNDSIIFVGEEKDSDSICLIDPPSGASSARKLFPRSPQRPFPGGTRKRKDYSDDEDQTKVLKPYSAGPNKGSAGRQEGRQEFAQAAEAAAFDSHPWEAATSSETTAVRDTSDLRFIVIDGSNVAMCHGNDKEYSCRGIKICVDYFVKRGHRVKAWVPRTKTYQNQTGRHPPVRDQHILEELKDQGYLGYTPARTFNHKHIVSHDDPFILELAQKEDAVIVSNDNFREFVGEFSFIIENRVLSYVFSDDHFMLPRDPLGRYGPTLEQFLHKSPMNPQKRAATDSSTLRPGPYSLASTSSQHGPGQGRIPPNHNTFLPPRQPHAGPRMFNTLHSVTRHAVHSMPRQAGIGGALFSSVLADGPAAPHPNADRPSSGTPRHEKVTEQLLEALKMVFPEIEQEAKIRQVLDNHCAETDLNKLTNYCIAALNL